MTALRLKLISGASALIFAPVMAVLPQTKAQRLRALATANLERAAN